MSTGSGVYVMRIGSNATGSTSAAGARTPLTAPCQKQHAAKSWSALGALSAGAGEPGAVLSGARHRACAPNAIVSLPRSFAELIGNGRWSPGDALCASRATNATTRPRRELPHRRRAADDAPAVRPPVTSIRALRRGAITGVLREAGTHRVPAVRVPGRGLALIGKERGRSRVSGQNFRRA